MRTISLREHQAASVGELPDGRFTLAEVEALDHAQRVLGAEVFRWTGRNQIRATQYVGIVVAGNVRLEVLPKIEGLGEGATRSALIQMIGIAWDVPVHDGAITDHDYQNRDLLELLIGLFARRLLEQVRAGLSRAYRRQQDDLSRLRGKLDVTRQFTRLAASPQTLACRFDEFTADTALNRLLLCAVIFLRRRSAHADNQRLLNEIAAHFSDVTSIDPSEALAGKFAIDRMNRRWEVSATLARHLLSSIYQTAHSGKRDGIALMFDMNLLFETYVAALARIVCCPLGYQVRAQGPMRCLARNEAGQEAFHTKPDLHIQSEERTIVLDTKWKHIYPDRPNFDVAQADAYQMHGYAHVYRSDVTILLFPHHPGLADEAGIRTSWRFASGGAALSVATINVAERSAAEATIRSLVAPSSAA